MAKKNEEFTYEVKENYGTIGEGTKGWKREVNLVSWSGKEAKIDIRDWNEDRSKMGKGISLTTEEARTLRDILVSMNLG